MVTQEDPELPVCGQSTSTLIYRRSPPEGRRVDFTASAQQKPDSIENHLTDNNKGNRHP